MCCKESIKGGFETAMRIRDSVVGDILFNQIEEYCIRTPTFQRLHRIKQLGNAFHIYPGANHTRFEHSLGVFYQVQRLLNNRDLYKYCPNISRDTSDDLQIIRLAALLHDIVHTPFRHTLDRDSAVIQESNRENEYATRIEQLSSEMKSLFSKAFSPEQKTRVLEILSAPKGYTLDKPYSKQIIEDTLSADLLDYTIRDCFHTGLQRKWDPRIYDHISIANHNNKPHIVANILDEGGNIAQSAITEIVNLMDIRYTLNERVYFYYVKIAADSLLIKAVRKFFTKTEITQDQFKELNRDMSDEDLINYLIKNLKHDGVNFAELLRDRRLPEVAAEFKTGENITDDEKKAIAKHCRGYDCHDKWSTVENNIGKQAGVSPDNVIVYCHDLEMQSKKKPEFLVLSDKNEEPRPIEGHDELAFEIQHIAAKQEKLWRCYVFSLNKEESPRIKEAAKEVLTSLT